MAETFLALGAHPIRGDIAFGVVYNPPITSCVRIEAKGKLDERERKRRRRILRRYRHYE